MKRKRILDKLVLTEISGVDRPCQEGAHVAIMKRKETTMDEVQELEGAVLDLEARVQELNKKTTQPHAPIAVNDFETTVTEIRKRDNCSRTDALVKARAENPNGFAAYNSDNTPNDFDALMAAEIAKGAPASVARQRVGLKFPNAAATLIAKTSGKHPFESVVDAIQEQAGVTRTVAMSRARRKEPAKFQHYQEA
jgi:hypothetical protein